MKIEGTILTTIDGFAATRKDYADVVGERTERKGRYAVAVFDDVHVSVLVEFDGMISYAAVHGENWYWCPRWDMFYPQEENV